jgi:hypothetical protein
LALRLAQFWAFWRVQRWADRVADSVGKVLVSQNKFCKKGGEVCERFSSGGAWRLVIQALLLRPPTLGLRKQRLNTPFFTPAPPPPFITQHASRNTHHASPIISHHYKNGEIRN